MPAIQNYQNHAHFPRPSALGFLFAGVALACFVSDPPEGRRVLGVSVTAWGLYSLLAAVFLLLAMSRTYITRLQDRIIRLEMRVRLKDVLPAARHVEIDRLTVDQLVALRFASDAELPALVHRALTERLTRKQIKQAIREWVGDYYRT